MVKISRKRIQSLLRSDSTLGKDARVSRFKEHCAYVLRVTNSPLASKIAGAEDPFLAAIESEQPDPKAYTDARVFARDWQAYHFLRKHPSDLSSEPKDLSVIALQSFAETEGLLQSLPVKLAEPCVGFPRDAIISIARRKIASMLGELTVDLFLSNLSLSSGASTRLRRKNGNPAFKLCGELHCTEDVEPLLRSFLYEDAIYMRQHRENGPVHPSAVKLKVVQGSRLTTVAKNAKTDRVIAIEPEGNMLFQKSIGRLIRASLMRNGIDLSDQSVNQRLAQYGSFTGSLATLDLEKASDTVSVDIVRELLPSEWFNFMDRIRSKCYTADDGQTYTPYVKFSSMGNGFTFELESLIFFALTWATTRYFGFDGYIGIFGDDIIAETEVIGEVKQMLNYCGFHINQSKSFVDGPFRESCGKHFFLGTDVTPFMVTKYLDDITDSLALLNKLREWQRNLGFPQAGTHVEKRMSLLGWPEVPPSFGNRAGLTSYDADLRYTHMIKNRMSVIEFPYLAQSSSRRRVPDFGNYVYKMMSHGFTAAAEEGFTMDAGKLEVRLSSKLSVWN